MPEGAKKIPKLNSRMKVGSEMIIGEGKAYDIQKVVAEYPVKESGRFTIYCVLDSLLYMLVVFVFLMYINFFGDFARRHESFKAIQVYAICRRSSLPGQIAESTWG